MKKIIAAFLPAVILFSCSTNVAKVDNSLKLFFDSANVQGTFSLFDNQKGDITLYNMSMDTQRVSPGYSFKIAATLVGVETARLTDLNTTFHTDKDSALTLKEAFDKNDSSYFATLINKIGRDTLRYWMDTLKYGNMETQPFLSFWNDGSLKISPDEQLGLLTKIYFNKLPLKKYSQSIVRDLLLKEDNTLYKFSFTTAKAVSAKGEPMAWALGWIEENLHVYLFTCLVSSGSSNADLEKTAIEITKKILVSKGFFHGKK